MRTTLTIEPDVQRLLQRAMQRTGKSMKAVINEGLRLGLGMRSKPSRASRFKVETHDFGFKPGIDQDRLNQLADELEAEHAAGRLAG